MHLFLPSESQEGVLVREDLLDVLESLEPWYSVRIQKPAATVFYCHHAQFFSEARQTFQNALLEPWPGALLAAELALMPCGTLHSHSR
jgi:hypothetical protein